VRVLLVVGARPNFMKAAPILRVLARGGHESILVHTGQHYDARMSDVFFRDLGLPEPDLHLGVGSASHAVQTARIMEAFEPVLLKVRPEWVVVVGDVNSTLACALVAAKLKEAVGCRIAHVEAGLRSGDWSMPEEVNRVLTDRLSDLLLTPSRDADRNLAAEGIEEDRIVFVGNVVVDTLLYALPEARRLDMPRRLGLVPQGYVVVTLHRPDNVDSIESLRAVFGALNGIAEEVPVVFPMHPRTWKNVQGFDFAAELGRFQVLEPVGYREMLSLVSGARAVLTDSGGLQQEATVLGVPCVTLRERTEWNVTVQCGTNRLAPWPLTAAGVRASYREALTMGAGRRQPPEGWDGRASERVIAAMVAG
jgi:UDP-N-acetylglucosamine 2-epimerase (non-hydrolysing)